MWSRADRKPRDAAVIDIGSNSIRLVLYRLEGRSIWTIYNEKVLAGLGRDLAHTGRLSATGRTAALTALRRFRAVLDSVGADSIQAVATAAVREAEDGPEFLHEVRRLTGLAVRVLSGDEEAKASALGVAAGIPGVDGLAGDLGGFSLELVKLKGQAAGRGVTLPLGPFALAGNGAFDAAAVRKDARALLRPIADSFAAETFFAVGGAWRNLALLHMQIARYPLQIVHQYEMRAGEALDAARLIAGQSRSSLERMEGVSKKRVDTLPYAAVVMEALIEVLGVKRIVVSAWGIREGLLYESMPPQVRELDPLIEGCAALGARQQQAEELGLALEDWMAPLTGGLPALFDLGRDAILIAAISRLADLGSRLHPDHRATLVFEQVLRAPIAGMSHAERAFLACAAFARHTSALPFPEADLLTRILSPERLQRARALGAAARLGCDLSGRNAKLLARSKLAIEGERVVLRADQSGADLLLGDQTAKRAANLAAVLGLGLKIEAV
jgi:exopolyphosphatase/guanosine-5'-triphosphate,3'-diphosphate pyrophosphatase